MAKKYIEREALLKKLEELLSDLSFIVNYEKKHGSLSDVEKSKARFEEMKGVINLVKSQPTADVQEVVRCKDCKNWDKKTLICSKLVSDKLPLPKGGRIAFKFDGNHFCSYGEKMDKE